MTESERIKYALVNVSLLARSDRYYSMIHGLVKIVKNFTIAVRIAVRGFTVTWKKNNQEHL